MPSVPLRRWWRARADAGAVGIAPGPPQRPRTPQVGTAAAVVVGVTPDGDLAAVEPRDGAVIFLTSSCLACREVWSALASGAAARDRVGVAAVVTPDAALEDRAAVAVLHGEGEHPVVMSGGAWRTYQAAGSPWVAVVMGGLVAAEGAATGWADVVALVRGDRPVP